MDESTNQSYDGVENSNTKAKQTLEDYGNQKEVNRTSIAIKSATQKIEEDEQMTARLQKKEQRRRGSIEMLNERIASKANGIVSINSTRIISDTTASVKSGLVQIQDDVMMTAKHQEKQQQRQSNLDILDDRIARKSFKEGEEKK